VTEQQWQSVRDLVENGLAVRNPYDTTSGDLRQRFGLEDDFYQSMLEYAERDGVEFSISRHYYSPEYPRMFDLRFLVPGAGSRWEHA